MGGGGGGTAPDGVFMGGGGVWVGKYLCQKVRSRSHQSPTPRTTATTPRAAMAGRGPKRPKERPIPGAIIRKEYKGRMLEVRVLEKGFEFEGKPYNTLSSVANAVTGAKWNGFLFFGI